MQRDQFLHIRWLGLLVSLQKKVPIFLFTSFKQTDADGRAPQTSSDQRSNSLLSTKACGIIRHHVMLPGWFCTDCAHEIYHHCSLGLKWPLHKTYKYFLKRSLSENFEYMFAYNLPICLYVVVYKYLLWWLFTFGFLASLSLSASGPARDRLKTLPKLNTAHYG